MPDPLAASVQALLPQPAPEAVVDEVIADARLALGPCGNGYSAERRDAVVKWLAAHMLAAAGLGQGSVVSESIDGASYTKARPTGDALRSTFYGQQALLLDSSGCLTGAGMERATWRVL